jgi:hypothetical protein
MKTYHVTVDFWEHPSQELTITTDADLTNCDRDTLMSEIDGCIEEIIGQALWEDVSGVDHGLALQEDMG